MLVQQTNLKALWCGWSVNGVISTSVGPALREKICEKIIFKAIVNMVSPVFKALKDFPLWSRIYKVIKDFRRKYEKLLLSKDSKRRIT